MGFWGLATRGHAPRSILCCLCSVSHIVFPAVAPHFSTRSCGGSQTGGQKRPPSLRGSRFGVSHPRPCSRLPQGLFVFKFLELVAYQSTPYHITFALKAMPEWPVPNVTSSAIMAQPCQPSEYFLSGDATCTACPVGGLCNGSALLARPGYWGKAGAQRFLPCRRAAACPGGAAPSECAPGFERPMCDLCQAGHHGAFCLRCPSAAVSMLACAGLLLLYLCIIGYTAHRAFVSSRGCGNPAFTVVYRMTISTLQLLFVQVRLPSALGRHCFVLVRLGDRKYALGGGESPNIRTSK